jgi:hypothetical protein
MSGQTRFGIIVVPLLLVFGAARCRTAATIGWVLFVIVLAVRFAG